MALTKVNGDGVGTLSSGLTLTSDDPTITMTDSSGTNDIATVQATSGALIITARDGSADGEIIFKKTDGSATDETMRIDNTGRVSIGTNSPHTADSVLTVQNGSGVAELNITSGTSGASLINMGDTADYNIGRIKYDQSTNTMQFNTNDGERIRIGSSGDVFFNQFTTSSPGQGNNTFGAVISDSGRFFSSANGTYALGLNRSDSGELTNFSRAGTFKGSISITASQVNYNQTSDHRLKENVSDMTGAITRLKTLQPKRFNFIADPDDTTVDGFLAHEVTAVPEAVTGTHNATDSDNNPIYQQIDQSKLVPLLVGALQEAITKIETLETQRADLETRVAALEAN